MKNSAIILAAGKGTRMNSERLKVAHEIAGKPILHYVIEATQQIPVTEVVLVVGHQAEALKNMTPYPHIQYVHQNQQLGTGHAVIQAAPLYEKKADETVFVLAGDCPLISPDTLEQLQEIHLESNAAATILTTKMANPASYGRILRGKMGTITGIKEAKDCTETELKINEINTGVYCFHSKHLFEALSKITTHNKQNEYYLTDVIHILKNEGQGIAGYCTPDPNEAIGINTRHDLAEINQIIYQRNNKNLMTQGITIIDPNSTYIDSTVEIGNDSIIYPFTMITGHSKIGGSCSIGPHAYIHNGKVEDNEKVPAFTNINVQ